MDAEPLPMTGDEGMKIDYDAPQHVPDDADMMQDDETTAGIADDADDEALMHDESADAASTTTTAYAPAPDGMAVEIDKMTQPDDVSTSAGLSLDLPPAGMIAAPAAVDSVGFSSPPLVTVSRDGLQTSLLGNSAQGPATAGGDGQSVLRHSPVITPSPEARYANGHDTSFSTASGLAAAAPSSDWSASPTSHAVVASGDLQKQSRDDLDARRALASQHQRTDDDKLSQEQTVENQGERQTTVTQRQSLEPERKGDTPARQENEVTIKQQSPDQEGGEWRTVVETNQRNQGGDVASHGGRIQQINHVKVYRRGEDTASKTLSGGALSRPDIRKDLLAAVSLGLVVADGSSAEDELAAAPVQLDYENRRFTLFGVVDGDEEAVPLFQEDDDHSLYFDQIESLFERLRTSLPDLPSKDQELELEFPDLGILLAEDSVYTRETCLYDFDRMHVGCSLPGRLRMRVASSRGRFARDFNALASHVAESFKAAGVGAVVPLDDEAYVGNDEREANNDEEAYRVEEEYVEVIDQAKDMQEGEAVAQPDVQEPEEGQDDNAEHGQDAWHDEEVVYAETAEENDEDAEDDVTGNDEFEEPENLEEALAELDSEDLNAYIEGAREDFVLSEHAEAQSEADREEPAAPEEQAEDNQVADDDTKGWSATTNDDTETAESEATLSATVAGEAPMSAASLLAPSVQLELSYDTPVGNGDEPPAVPVDQLDAVIDAAAASDAIASASALEPGVGGASDAAAAEVVTIDYDEADPAIDELQGNASASEKASQVGTSGSPGEKRDRTMAEAAEAEQGADGAGEGEAKRARIDSSA
ncbi:hypothetical protein OIV83_004018 [Microbotryomycetes sp. JL201]|nr:hypothetical protein OIV83_004018 [Microbotryomycetes sp. JL201]